MNEKKARMQALWRAAFTNPEPTRIDCKSQSAAIRFRLDMYNSVKKVRTGDEGDAKLKEAVENIMLTSDPGDKAVIVLRRKMADFLSEQIDAILAQSGETVVDPETAGADDSFARLQELMKKQADPNLTIAPPEGKKNPYY